MKKIDIKEILQTKTENKIGKLPKYLENLLFLFLNKFLKISEINDFIELNNLKSGIHFIDSLFEYLNVSYEINKYDIERIPSEGRLLVVSNHPLGGLDGLALLKTISEVRSDVRIVANDILLNISNLNNLFLPIDLYSNRKHKQQIEKIEEAFSREEVVILFPAAQVSRLYLNGIYDKKWTNGAVKFSSRYEVPILPAFIHSRNSIMFYISSLINSNLGTLMLPQELFRKRNSKFKIAIGDVIPKSTFKNMSISPKMNSKLLRNHVYRIGKNKKGIFNTEKTIIHPINPRIIKSELNKNILLDTTYDGKKIYLVDYDNGANILREISRLREFTFRKVGEGTGKTCDFDVFDLYYKHIVLWDPVEMQIVGAYRLANCNDVVSNFGKKGLYNSMQFKINDNFNEILEKSIEVGRSFIQPKYWRSNALDFIWQGIGKYLAEYPEIRYLWGAVSISDTYPEIAKGLIISYYNKWYNCTVNYVEPLNNYKITHSSALEIQNILTGKTAQEDYLNLKNALKNYSLTVPILYKRYTEMTEYGSSQFISFCVDIHFNNSIDGLILVDLYRMKQEYKERYYSSVGIVEDINLQY